MKKNSNFSNSEFSLYKENDQVFNIEDIAPTLSALMDLEIPILNQGKFIDEIVQSFSNLDKTSDYLYLKLREQQQKLNHEIIKSKKKILF